ncbi:MAG: hypothetical protein OEW69_10590 [Nitrospirota bacterium]|nr:hypothetical protein [Nitrospirota bacterium]
MRKDEIRNVPFKVFTEARRHYYKGQISRYLCIKIEVKTIQKILDCFLQEYMKAMLEKKCFIMMKIGGNFLMN